MADYNLVVEPRISKRTKKNLDTPSTYKPDERTMARLMELKSEFVKFQEIRNYAFREFNYRSLYEYADDCQDRFMNFINDLTEGDPSQAWRANTVRPLTRNKVIEIAAYVTTRIMYPRVIAQNEESDVDMLAGSVMEDLMQWTNTQSKYDISFMNAVISMLVFPVTFMYEGYAEYKRDFKEVQPDGSFKTVKKIDDVFSGFQSITVGWDEVYPMNAYEANIQKQPALVWRRIIDYSAAKIKYGNNPEFKYVKPGTRIYLDDSQSVYEQQDESLNSDGVEEIIYYNRLADLELRMLNGVMMDDPDRPIQRKDKRYPFAKSGYGLFDDGKFFYYKSLVDDLKPDQDQADILINLILDGTYLKMMPPSVLYGDEILQTDVMVPGTVHPLNKDTELKPIQLSGDVGLGVNVLQNIEQNASNSSQKDIVQPRQQTAYEISRIEEDVKTKLGLFGKMIADMVLQYGDLRIPTVIQYLTMPQVGEITSPNKALEYSRFLIEDKSGPDSNRFIEFSDEFAEFPEGMTDEEYEQKSIEVFIAEGGNLEGNNKEIIKVNPDTFRRYKYRVKINPNTIFKTSEAAERAFALELSDRLLQDPLADQNSRFKLLIDAYKPGEVEKFKMKEQPMQPNVGPQVPGRTPTGGKAGSNILNEVLETEAGATAPPQRVA